MISHEAGRQFILNFFTIKLVLLILRFGDETNLEFQICLPSRNGPILLRTFLQTKDQLSPNYSTNTCSSLTCCDITTGPPPYLPCKNLHVDPLIEAYADRLLNVYLCCSDWLVDVYLASDWLEGLLLLRGVDLSNTAIGLLSIGPGGVSVSAYQAIRHL